VYRLPRRRRLLRDERRAGHALLDLHGVGTAVGAAAAARTATAQPASAEAAARVAAAAAATGAPTAATGTTAATLAVAHGAGTRRGRHHVRRPLLSARGGRLRQLGRVRLEHAAADASVLCLLRRRGEHRRLHRRRLLLRLHRHLHQRRGILRRRRRERLWRVLGTALSARSAAAARAARRAALASTTELPTAASAAVASAAVALTAAAVAAGFAAARVRGRRRLLRTDVRVLARARSRL